MTVIKQFGKLASPALSFGSTIDDQVHNTNRGSSSGEGWNMPGSTNPIWDGKFPVNHTYFWNEEPNVTISPDWAFSCAIRSNLLYPRINAALTDITTRAQYETIRPQTRIAFGFSLYIPSASAGAHGVNAEYYRRNIFQRFGGNSPGFSMYLDFRSNGKDWLSVRYYRDGVNLIYCPITEVEKDTWYHIIGFCDFRNDLGGRMTVWLDQKIARVFPRIGSGEATAVYSKVPVTTGSGSYQRADNLGDFVGGTVTENGFTQTLLDWKGLTARPDENVNQGQWNWGPYPGRFRWYSLFPDIESKAQTFPNSPVTEWGQVPLKNFDNPSEPDYLDPQFHVVEFYSNFTLAIWGDGQTDEDIFQEVHPLGLSPLEFPTGESAWPNGFQLNPSSSQFNLTLINSDELLGTVARNVNNPITGGQAVELTATPITGYQVQWRQDSIIGNILSQELSYNHIMNSNITIVAVFVQQSIPPGPLKKLRFRFPKQPIT